MSLIEDTIKPAIEMLKGIKPKDRVAIIHGHDADALCSAAIMYKLLQKLGAKPVTVAAELNFAVKKSVLGKLKKIKPDYIVIVDLSDITEVFRDLVKIGKVLDIDHHVPNDYKGIAYVNPRIYDREIYLPTSYLCYKIYQEFFDASEVSWVASIGVLGDHGVTSTRDLFEDLKAAYSELVGDAEFIDEQLYEKSLLGKLVGVVDSARVVADKNGYVAALGVLLDARNYQDVLQNKQLNKWKKISSEEFRRLVKDFRKRKRSIGNSVFYEIKSKYAFKSPLAGYLAQFFDGKIVVIAQDSGRFYDVSFRRGENVRTDLAELSHNIAKIIPDSNGGGHPPAAGLRIPKKEKERFLALLEGI